MCLPTTMTTSTSDDMVHTIQAYAKVWSPFTIDDEFIRDFLHRGVREGDTVDRWILALKEGKGNKLSVYAAGSALVELVGGVDVVPLSLMTYMRRLGTAIGITDEVVDDNFVDWQAHAEAVWVEEKKAVVANIKPEKLARIKAAWLKWYGIEGVIEVFTNYMDYVEPMFTGDEGRALMVAFGGDPDNEGRGGLVEALAAIDMIVMSV